MKVGLGNVLADSLLVPNKNILEKFRTAQNLERLTSRTAPDLEQASFSWVRRTDSNEKSQSNQSNKSSRRVWLSWLFFPNYDTAEDISGYFPPDGLATLLMPNLQMSSPRLNSMQPLKGAFSRTEKKYG